MQKTTTLTKLKLFFGKMLPLLVLLAITAGTINAQPYINGNLSTGATSSNGTAAPAGYTWSEVQLGNNSAGFGANITAGLTLADNFSVPSGVGWNLSKLTFYAYSTGFAGTTSPFTDVRFRIYNVNPSIGTPTPIFGDLTTNRFSASSEANMYRIFNATPGTTRKIWKVEANLSTVLGPGSYWIEWQLGNGGLSNFSPASTVVGTVTQPGNNALQNTVATNTWVNLVDGANQQDMPFRIDYTVVAAPACVPITASVLSAVNNTPICAGGSKNLRVNITGGNGPYTVVYNNGVSNVTVNNYVSGANIPVTPAVTTTYTLVSVTGIDGCVGTNNSGTAVVTVANAPTSSVLSQVQLPGAPINLINETFTTAIPLPAGWAQQNLSTPAGTNPVWFQGNTTVFAGNTPPGYIACNFNSVGGANTISNWLFVPNVTLKNGDKLSFFTRTTDGTFPDRLQVRMSTNGTSVNVGASNTSVGDFSTLLLDINPTYTGTGYPTAWTQFTVTLSGLPAAGVSGRLAFRYFVENGGPTGNNSDYIGLDDVVYTTTGTTPPTTCTGSTTNLKVDINAGNAPYTVTINTVPPTTPIVVNNYTSGAYIPVTPAVTTTYSLTSVVTAEGCVGTGNSGTPTVVVSPTPVNPLIVIANPNAPVCAGSSVLLTAVQGSGATPVSYVQAGASTNAINSQKFEAANAAFDNQGADDFTVPAGPGWSVTQVNVAGQYFNGPGPAASVNVTFYSNAGTLPGAVIASFNNVAYTNSPNFNIVLPSAVALPGGATYWVSVQVNQNFTPAGQWGWSVFGATNTLSERAWRNPGAGFGTPCTNYGPGATGCGVGTERNHVFTIIGTTQASGTIPPGWTFVWAPTAGLSNPVSNPVAASPMNTTTYTVIGTAPNGCNTSANYTVVVNQLPAVTTQPTNVTVCDGLPASFTIVASGAGPLTYQWQVSTDGGVTYSNLANNAPYSNVTTATLNIAPTSGSLNGNKYRCVVSGVCSPAANSNGATLTVTPLPVIPITPPGPLCGGIPGTNGVALTAGTAAPPVPGTFTIASGTINLAVPDNTANGVSTNLSVAGIPANATITNVSVKLNMSHTYPGDMIYNLKAPNGQILSLYKYAGGLFTGPASGVPTWGWYNAVVSSAGTANFSSVATAPFIYGASPIWKADALNTTVAGTTIQNPTGFVSNANSFADLYSTPNGTWTLAMADGGGGDVGSLANWSITIDYTTPGVGSGGALTYIWSPTAGLFTNPGATIPYTGTNLATVYAAPSAFTVYTVTGTSATTGCVGTNTVSVNYTPPAPSITPNPVSICVGNPTVAALMKKTSSISLSLCANPNLAVPDNTANGVSSVISVSGIPANAVILSASVKLNMSHTYPGDMIFNLKAPNGQILNLYKYNGGTFTGPASGVPTWGWYNASIKSNGTVAHSTVAVAPFIYNSTTNWKADALNSAVAGTTIQNPAGFVSAANSFSDLYSTPNGAWTLAMADGGAGDVGTLSSWCLDIVYSLGVPSTSPVWSPIAGLYSDAGATVPYVAGTAVDSVWVIPTAVGTTNYQATVQSLPVPDPSNTTSITIPSSGPGTPYPSAINVIGYPTTGVSVKNVILNGVTHTWGNDIDVLLQSPTGQNVVLMSDVGGTVPVPNATYTFDDAATNSMSIGAANPTGSYKPTNSDITTDNWPAPGPGAFAQAAPALSLFGSTANVNGSWKLFVVDDTGGDQGSISGGWSIKFTPPFAACTSPATTIPVTLNDSVRIVTNPPLTFAVCTDKATSISVAAVGTGLAYKWEVSSNNGGTWATVANGGVYSGATTNTLTISAPPVSMNGYLYRAIVSGASPCGSKTSTPPSRLIVNPLPTVVISASPYTKLFPGLTTTLTHTSSPAAASFVWKRNGAVVGGNTASLPVDVDGLGNYTLTVTDVNGCVNSSNLVAITDSASGRVFIYPNPNSGVFQVRYYSGLNNANLPRGLNVYDAKGARVDIENTIISAPYGRMNVDLRKQGKGVYWVEVVDRNGDRLAVGRVVVL